MVANAFFGDDITGLVVRFAFLLVARGVVNFVCFLGVLYYQDVSLVAIQVVFLYRFSMYFLGHYYVYIFIRTGGFVMVSFRCRRLPSWARSGTVVPSFVFLRSSLYGRQRTGEFSLPLLWLGVCCPSVRVLYFYSATNFTSFFKAGGIEVPYLGSTLVSS